MNWVEDSSSLLEEVIEANDKRMIELASLVRIARYFNKVGNAGQVEALLEYAASQLIV